MTPAALVLALVPALGAAEPKTDVEKDVYAFGYVLGQNYRELDLSAGEAQLFADGLRAALRGEAAAADPEKRMERIAAFRNERQQKAVAKVKERSAEHLAKLVKEKGSEKTGSGLVFTPLKEGKGDSPKAADRVKVHYTGTLVDGTVFDSSVQRGEPAEFPLNGVIPCWTEGVQKMKPGGKARLACPSDIAYGDRGRPPKIPGGASLLFEVELLEVLK